MLLGKTTALKILFLEFSMIMVFCKIVNDLITSKKCNISILSCCSIMKTINLLIPAACSIKHSFVEKTIASNRLVSPSYFYIAYIADDRLVD